MTTGGNGFFHTSHANFLDGHSFISPAPKEILGTAKQSDQYQGKARQKKKKIVFPTPRLQNLPFWCLPSKFTPYLGLSF